MSTMNLSGRGAERFPAEVWDHIDLGSDGPYTSRVESDKAKRSLNVTCCYLHQVLQRHLFRHLVLDCQHVSVSLPKLYFYAFRKAEHVRKCTVSGLHDQRKDKGILSSLAQNRTFFVNMDRLQLSRIWIDESLLNGLCNGSDSSIVLNHLIVDGCDIEHTTTDVYDAPSLRVVNVTWQLYASRLTVDGIWSRLGLLVHPKTTKALTFSMLRDNVRCAGLRTSDSSAFVALEDLAFSGTTTAIQFILPPLIKRCPCLRRIRIAPHVLNLPPGTTYPGQEYPDVRTSCTLRLLKGSNSNLKSASVPLYALRDFLIRSCILDLEIAPVFDSLLCAPIPDLLTDIIRVFEDECLGKDLERLQAPQFTTTQLTDESLALIAKRCPRLQALSIVLLSTKNNNPNDLWSPADVVNATRYVPETIRCFRLHDFGKGGLSFGGEWGTIEELVNHFDMFALLRRVSLIYGTPGSSLEFDRDSTGKFASRLLSASEPSAWIVNQEWTGI